MKDKILKDIREALMRGDRGEVASRTQAALDAGIAIPVILDDGLISGVFNRPVEIFCYGGGSRSRFLERSDIGNGYISFNVIRFNGIPLQRGAQLIIIFNSRRTF